jgi:hypothetical protein
LEIPKDDTGNPICGDIQSTYEEVFIDEGGNILTDIWSDDRSYDE